MENMEFLKAVLAEMNGNMKANQEKADANAKAMQDMLARIDTNRGTHCEALNDMQARMKDTMESQIGFLGSRMEADRKTNREEMKAAIQSIWSERDETIQQRVENIMTCVNHKTESLQKACHKETETYTEKIQPNPRMMQSVAEHQEVPKEEATVMLVRGLRKWHGDWNLATGRHQKPKGRIQANCESRKRLTVASRRMTRYAGVAWFKRGVVRKDCTRAKVE
jgi:hypothetical protein